VGSSTYHTAIIARSLGIPAVVGLEMPPAAFRRATRWSVDGTRGRWWSSRRRDALQAFREAQEPATRGARLRETRASPR
jgi:phosphocarrier protein FPr